MRPKSLLLLALALGCGLIAAIGINQVMANRSQQPDAEHGEMSPIFIALRDVGLGDPLTPLSLKLEEWPKSKIPAGAMTKLEDIEGRRARTKFFAGEPIIDAKLFAKGEQGSGATDLIPKGMRVVVVKVDDVSGSGLILPGDRVDVLVHVTDHAGDMAKNSRTSTRTFLHNVKVFAVNNVYSRESNGETVITAKTISLLVTPQQAEMVTMASEMGRIRLVMRSADDETESESTGVTPHQLMGTAEEGPTETAPPPHAFRNPPIIATAPAPVSPTATAPDMKNSWKMLMIEGDAVSEVEFEDGTRMGSPTQIRQIHQGTRGGSGAAAAAMPLPASSPLPPSISLPELPPIKIDTDPPPSDAPPTDAAPAPRAK